MTDLTIAEIFKLQKKREKALQKSIDRNKTSQIKRNNVVFSKIQQIAFKMMGEAQPYDRP